MKSYLKNVEELDQSFAVEDGGESSDKASSSAFVNNKSRKRRIPADVRSFGGGKKSKAAVIAPIPEPVQQRPEPTVSQPPAAPTISQPPEPSIPKSAGELSFLFIYQRLSEAPATFSFGEKSDAEKVESKGKLKLLIILCVIRTRSKSFWSICFWAEPEGYKNASFPISDFCCFQQYQRVHFIFE